MGITDWILVILIAAYGGYVLFSKKKTGCCGDCSRCAGCAEKKEKTLL